MENLIKKIQEQLDNNWPVEADDIQALIDFIKPIMTDLTTDEIKSLLEKMHGCEFKELEIYKDVYDKCSDWFLPRGDEYLWASQLHNAGCLIELSIPVLTPDARYSGMSYKYKKVKKCVK